MSEHGITVSMKPTTKYDSPMLVFKGENEDHLRGLIEDFFDLDGDSDATTAELVHETDALIKALYALGDGLGAKVDRDTRKPSKAALAIVAPQIEHVWGTVLQGIADAKTTADIARLYATNKDAWSDPDVQAAAKNRAEELS